MSNMQFTGTKDRITGKFAPLGEITGFAKSHVKSAWPTPVGKRLTDGRIRTYIKKGFYGTLEQLRYKALHGDKASRAKAKKELERFDGKPVSKQRAKVNRFKQDIEEFL